MLGLRRGASQFGRCDSAHLRQMLALLYAPTPMSLKTQKCAVSTLLLCAAVSAYPQELSQSAVQLLTALVKIDTSNPPGNEIKAAEYIRNVLKSEGIDSEIVESAPGRANLIARLKGNGS